MKPSIRSSSAPDQHLHEAFGFIGRLRSQNFAHRQLRHADRDALAPRLALGQADMRERRVGEHHMRDQPIIGPAVTASHVVPDDPEIIDRDMRELRAPGAFADRPDAGGGRLRAAR